jgi:hypothetical protein
LIPLIALGAEVPKSFGIKFQSCSGSTLLTALQDTHRMRCVVVTMGCSVASVNWQFPSRGPRIPRTRAL